MRGVLIAFEGLDQSGKQTQTEALAGALTAAGSPCERLSFPDYATPIGTGSDESPVHADLLRADLSVLDLVYRPSPTRLVRDARAAGASATDGAGVLLRQAAASFSLWTGQPAPIEVMRDALRAELGPDAGA